MLMVKDLAIGFGLKADTGPEVESWLLGARECTHPAAGISP
jgi:hypothetical protein